MKKRIFSILLCIALCLSMLPLAAFAENTASGDGWYLDDQGCLHITGVISKPGTSVFAAPWTNYREQIVSVAAETGASIDNCSSLFYECSNMVSCDLSLLDTEGVTNMASMFWGCSSLEDVNLSGLDTSAVTNMSYMFMECASLTSVDLSSFDTSSLTTMQGMFCECGSLTSVDISGFSFASERPNFCDVFAACNSLSTLTVGESWLDMAAVILLDYSPYWRDAESGTLYTTADALKGISGTATLNVARDVFVSGDGWYLDNDGCLHVTGAISYSGDSAPWENYRDLVISAVALSGSSTDNGVRFLSLCENLEWADLSELNTFAVTDMTNMFADCCSLEYLDLSGFNTANVDEMTRMFSGCGSLESLDLSSFATSGVVYMTEMFEDCSSLSYLDVSSFTVGEGAVVADLFSGCDALAELVVSGSMLDAAADQVLELSRNEDNTVCGWKDPMNDAFYVTEEELEEIGGTVFLLNLKSCCHENSYYDVTEEEHVLRCMNCNAILSEPEAHELEWCSDSNYHWQQCATCEFITNLGDHSSCFDEAEACTVCGRAVDDCETFWYGSHDSELTGEFNEFYDFVACLYCGEPGVWRHNATCDQPDACMNCGRSVSDGISIVIGHYYGESDHDDYTHYMICSECGEHFDVEFHYDDDQDGFCDYCEAEVRYCEDGCHKFEYETNEYCHRRRCTVCGLFDGSWEAHGSCLDNAAACVICGKAAEDCETFEYYHNFELADSDEEFDYMVCSFCGEESYWEHRTTCDHPDVCGTCGKSASKDGIELYVEHNYEYSGSSDERYDYMVCPICGDENAQEHVAPCIFPDTCSVCGQSASDGIVINAEHYFVEEGCDDYSHYIVCLACGEKIHNEWHFDCDGDGLCDYCGAETHFCEDGEHVFRLVSDEFTHAYECEICGFVDGYREAHGSCLPGATECAFCGRPAEECVDFLSDYHYYELSDSYDELCHWRVCTACGDTVKMPHFETCEEPGVCVDCGRSAAEDGIILSESYHAYCFSGDYDEIYDYFICEYCGRRIASVHTEWCGRPGVCTQCLKSASDGIVIGETDHDYGLTGESDEHYDYAVCADCGEEISVPHTAACDQPDVCELCGKTASDGIVLEIEHYGGDIAYDSDVHYVICSKCGEHYEVGPHFDDDGDGFCDACACPLEPHADGWSENADGEWKYYENGAAVTDWKRVGKKWYYFDSDGIMQTGWQQIGSKWYYLGTDGAMRTGWQQISKKWYYLGTDGAMQTDWQQIDGSWYYLGTDGAMRTKWQQVSKKWYYLGTDGAMQTGWQEIGGSWYYLGTDGAMRTDWQKVGKQWYYFGSDGAMRSGWQQISKKWYYLGTDGAMRTKWQQVGGTWYYLGTDGAMQTDWQRISKKWYYLGTDGAMRTGKITVDGVDYDLGTDGAMIG